MKPFNKRHYANFGQFLADLAFIFKNLGAMRRMGRQKLVSGPFRERLMLAVTQVNDCRFCSYAHTKAALVEGLSGDEVKALLEGDLEVGPPEEAPALFYAQHWAETGGEVEPGAHEKLVEHYGAEKAEAIGVVLRVIRTGNYTGNTFDYFLYRLSFGRWGV